MSARDANDARSEELKRGWLVPVIIGSALLMQTLNATVIINALPAIAHTFGVEPLRLNLAITVYMLSTAVFLPLSGWLADRFGARRIFLFAIALYACGSLACAASTGFWTLIAARVLEGAAGAALLPVGRLVLLRTTPKSELVGAFSVLTLPALLGPVLGPALGGAIVTFADWRWIFLMNLPLAVAGLYLVRRYVPEVRETETGPLDIVGILLTGAGLAAMIFGFEMVSRERASVTGGLGLLAGGAALLLTYVWHARRTPHAVVDLAVFQKLSFRASVIGGGFMRIATGATPFLLVMLLQVVFGFSPLVAGGLIGLSSLGALLMKTTAPPILRRFGFRRVLLANAGFVALSFMVCALFRADWPQWLLALILGVGGYVRTLQLTALNGLSYADLGQEEMSRAATAASMVQLLLNSVGIGLAVALLHVVRTLRNESDVSLQAVTPTFLVLGAISLISLVWFLPLARDAGAEISGHKSGPTA